MATSTPKLLTAEAALKRLRRDASPEKAAQAARYFKTGPGEYGEGDRFLGLTVPQVRAIAREAALPLGELEHLLASEWHEARLLALLLYVRMFEARPAAGEGAEDVAERRRALYQSYLAHTEHVDNWDLVDQSAPTVVGGYLFERSRAPLARLARSQSVWERRIAMLATYRFIVEGQSDDALRIATMLLGDEHDLIHKAVGWMLREVGKRCGEPVLRRYLDEHAGAMPRTALRYAIERMDAASRAHYLGLPREPGRRARAPRAAAGARIRHRA